MARPKDGYYIDGQRVPGVTTITSRFKPSGGLVAWANKLGLEGKDYREVRDAAADAGTVAHDMVEADIYGAAFDRSAIQPEILDKAQGAFAAYLTWKTQQPFEIVETELPLVSRQYRFGGTLDALARINGFVCLLDWKTSGACYPEFLVQLSAYQILVRECRPELQLSSEAHLLRFSKQEHPDDPVSFTHHCWSNLDLAKEQFLLYLKAYENDKRLNKMV